MLACAIGQNCRCASIKSVLCYLTVRCSGPSNASLIGITGCRMGVVGRTGAGKSSLISVVMRLVDAEAGVVKLDGAIIESRALLVVLFRC